MWCCNLQQEIGTHRLAFLSLLALGSLCALRLETLGWHVLSQTNFWPDFRFILCCMPNNETMLFCKNQAETQWKSYLLDLNGSQNSRHPNHIHVSLRVIVVTRPLVFVQVIQSCTHRLKHMALLRLASSPSRFRAAVEVSFPSCNPPHKHLYIDTHITFQAGFRSYVQGTSKIGATLKLVPRKIGSRPLFKFHGL